MFSCWLHFRFECLYYVVLVVFVWSVCVCVCACVPLFKNVHLNIHMYIYMIVNRCSICSFIVVSAQPYIYIIYAYTRVYACDVSMAPRDRLLDISCKVSFGIVALTRRVPCFWVCLKMCCSGCLARRGDVSL